MNGGQLRAIVAQSVAFGGGIAMLVGAELAWVGGLFDVLGDVRRFIGAIELGLVEGVAIPLRDGFTAAGSSVYGALEQLRLWAESGLMELGIAAPFALIASWLVLVIIIAVIAQVIYGFLEAYLPTESLTGAVDVLRTAVGGDE